MSRKCPANVLQTFEKSEICSSFLNPLCRNCFKDSVSSKPCAPRVSRFIPFGREGIRNHEKALKKTPLTPFEFCCLHHLRTPHRTVWCSCFLDCVTFGTDKRFSVAARRSHIDARSFLFRPLDQGRPCPRKSQTHPPCPF